MGWLHPAEEAGMRRSCMIFQVRPILTEPLTIRQEHIFKKKVPDGICISIKTMVPYGMVYHYFLILVKT